MSDKGLPPRDSTDKGIKFDGHKPRTDLLPGFPLLQVANVLSLGAHKYGDHNWRAGMKWTRPYAAALRHLLAWIEGEDNDQESGLNHIDHALCELMFLRQYIKDYPDNDDRYNAYEKELRGDNKPKKTPFVPVLDDYMKAAQDQANALGRMVVS